MIRHVVFFCWQENISDEQRLFAINEVASLAALPSIIQFSSGKNIARSKYHYAAVMDFPNQAAVDEFWRDATHRQVMANLKPFVADVAMADFEVAAVA